MQKIIQHTLAKRQKLSDLVRCTSECGTCCVEDVLVKPRLSHYLFLLGVTLKYNGNLCDFFVGFIIVISAHI